MLIVLPEKDAENICAALRDKCFLFETITAPQAIEYLNNMIGDIYDVSYCDPGYDFMVLFPNPPFTFSKSKSTGQFSMKPVVSFNFSLEV